MSDSCDKMMEDSEEDSKDSKDSKDNKDNKDNNGQHARLSWCLGESVMRALFERGQFNHILEKIFFSLDPGSLLSCSLTCKMWHSFLQKNVWYNLQGQKRIVDNWSRKNPNRKCITLALHKSNPNNQMSLVPFSFRPDMPRCVAADDGLIVVAILGTIDAYDRRTKQFMKRVFVGNLDLQWKVVLSKNFVIAKQMCHQGGRLEVFDRKNNLERIEMNSRYPPDCISPKEIHLTDDDLLLVETFSDGIGYLPKVQAFTIANLNYELQWMIRRPYSVLALAKDNVVLCGKEIHDHRCHLYVHDFQRGSERSRMHFEADETQMVRGVTASLPLVIVLLSSTSEHHMADGFVTFRQGQSQLYLCDMAHGFLLRRFNVDCNRYFGDLTSGVKLWSDPPVGHLIMAANGTNVTASKILIWNLLELLKEVPDDVDDVEPTRVIETRGLATGDVVVPSQHQLLFPSVDQKQKGVLVECEFWGNLA